MRIRLRLALSIGALGAAVATHAAGQPDFSGVWGMVQHDRPGAPFFTRRPRVVSG